MADAKINITYTKESVGKDKVKITAKLYYYGNGVTYNYEDVANGTITIAGVTSPRKYHSFTTSSSAQLMMSWDYTVSRYTSSRDIKISGSWNTEASPGILKDSATTTIDPLPKYTHTFKANGGATTPSAITHYFGKSFTMPKAITRTGFTFKGWNTKSDGTGTNYSAGSVHTINSSDTLYAKWTEHSYTIKYNSNGGTGTLPSSQSPNYTTVISIRDRGSLSRQHYSFTNWNTKSDGTGTTYKAGQSVSKLTSVDDGTINLYAQWTRNTRTLTFKTSATAGNYNTQITARPYEGTTYTFPEKVVNVPPLCTFTGYWSSSKPAKIYNYGDNSYTRDGSKSAIVGSADATYYALYIDSKPSSIQYKAIGVNRVKADTTLNQYISGIYNNENDYLDEDSETVMGYLEFTNIDVTNNIAQQPISINNENLTIGNYSYYSFDNNSVLYIGFNAGNNYDIEDSAIFFVGGPIISGSMESIKDIDGKPIFKSDTIKVPAKTILFDVSANGKLIAVGGRATDDSNERALILGDIPLKFKLESNKYLVVESALEATGDRVLKISYEYT